MAVQVEEVIRLHKANGLPMPPSDKGVQRLAQGRYGVLDDGSGAFDVFLDGGSDDNISAFAQCRGYAYPRRGTWKFGAIAKMYMYDMPASIPDATRTRGIHSNLAHEFVHVAQCAVTNPPRLSTASDLQGPWVEAVPDALAASLIGGRRSTDPCTKEAKLLSPNGGLASQGYGQWPFWYSLLEAPSAITYTALLRDVMRAPVKQAGPQLARAIRKRFTDKQISQALLTWANSSYFGVPLPSASGVPISTYPVMVLGGEYEPLADSLTPPAGGSASAGVSIQPLTCAALLVPWPDGAQNLTVSATGAPSGDLADVVTVALDVPPGSPATAPCGAYGERTVVPLTGNQFTATRPCLAWKAAPEMWVVMVNGGTAPLKLTVTATSS
ncbi:MAG: hypothetical protein IPO93_07145 [Actinobacteria bacterium]|nr:hypothetical protein [Actinomycetota bacterium]